MMKKLIFTLVALSLLISCNKDDDNVIDNPNQNLPENSPEVANFPVQNFMWRAMNLWYFWQESVPNLADDRFSTNAEYATFLASAASPAEFYTSLQFNEDRFSFANEDYTTLVNNLVGISKSNGLEFGLVRFGEGEDIFGFVRYIVAGSDASTKNIKRGDIFTRVDGQQLNLDNYRNLLFGANDTYTLGLAEIVNNTINDIETEVSLTKMEGLQENPVLLSSVLEVNGVKIAYLMYNGFNRNFNDELNEAFAGFNAEGASELIVDLRYNPGGSVNTSRLLASMIYGPNTNDLYIRQRYNDKIQEQLSAAQVEDFFANNVDGDALNSMNLSKVYVITTNSSASASELLINGLDPYIEVIQIGETTRGKNEFSITMVDDPENSFIYSESRENQINPENSWAIQPLIGRNENAAGFSDYTSGLLPDVFLEEDITNLGVLGDINEPLLARTLELITSSTGKRNFEVKMPAKLVSESKLFTPVKDNMWLDKPLSFK